MIIVELIGGLGNQMFQYAFGRHLADLYSTDLILDTTFLLNRDHATNRVNFVYRNFDLSIFQLGDYEFFDMDKATNYNLLKSDGSKIFQRLFPFFYSLKPITQKSFEFQPTFIEKITDNSYLSGYWQSEKYFLPTRELIKKEFQFVNSITSNCESLKNQISSCPSVCLNVRRGDFVTNPVHGTIGLDYYISAEEVLLKKGEAPHIFVFSDDIDWCKKNIVLQSPVTFVSHKYAGHKFRDYFELMLSCKHFIIPNSSFAWWAAWLATNDSKIVIAPKKWFGNGEWSDTDIIPNNWIKI